MAVQWQLQVHDQVPILKINCDLDDEVSIAASNHFLSLKEALHWFAFDFLQARITVSNTTK